MMVVECCGKGRESRFCPNCGAALRTSSPLEELHVYVRQTAGAKRTAVRTAKEEQEREGVNEWNARRLKKLESVLARWESWESALAELLSPE